MVRGCSNRDYGVDLLRAWHRFDHIAPMVKCRRAKTSAAKAGSPGNVLVDFDVSAKVNLSQAPP